MESWMSIFLSTNDFSIHIKNCVKENKTTIISEIINYCHENMVEFEEISKYISPSLKELIRIEAQDDSLLPKNNTNSLDI